MKVSTPTNINYDMNEFNKKNNRVTHYYTYLSFFIFIFGLIIIIVSKIVNKNSPTWFASAILANSIAVGIIGEIINTYGVAEKLEVICPDEYLGKVDKKINNVNIECVKYSLNSNFIYHFVPLLIAIIMAFCIRFFCKEDTKNIPMSLFMILMFLTVWLFCPDEETGDILIDKIKLVYPEANFLFFMIGFPTLVLVILFIIQR